jgi:hypothetical protein
MFDDWIEFIHTFPVKDIHTLGSGTIAGQNGTLVVVQSKDGELRSFLITDVNFSKWATGTGSLTIPSSSQAAGIGITIPNTPFTDSNYVVMITGSNTPPVLPVAYYWSYMISDASDFNVYVTLSAPPGEQVVLNFGWLAIE